MAKGKKGNPNFPCHHCGRLWTDEERAAPIKGECAKCYGCGARSVVPIPGPQERFLRSTADIVIFGGGVGGSKTFALIMEASRHYLETNFTAIIFRRTSPEITAPGGPWDTSRVILPDLGFVSRRNHVYMDWRHPVSGSTIKFSHLFREEDKEKHKGGQYALICWDELTSFTEEQFTFLLSRNRSASGCNVGAYVRASTNPNADSWVRDWIAPWGVPDHFLFNSVKYGDKLHFRRFEDETPDSIKPYVLYRAPADADRGKSMVWVSKDCPLAKTITYIPSTLHDNPHIDSDYQASVEALSKIERIRLMGGHPHCWLIRASAGLVFNSEWFVRLGLNETPPEYIQKVRCWDLAASKDAGDWTVGLLVGVTQDGRFGIIDERRGQWSAAEVEREIKRAAGHDGTHVRILIEEEKGAAGKNLIQTYRSLLPGHSVMAVPVTGDKVVRSQRASARNENRLIIVHPFKSRESYINEMDGFPTAKHDDRVDATSGAINNLVMGTNVPTVARVRMGRFF